MSAIELLTAQHREVEQRLSRLFEVEGGARVRLIGEIAELLTLHTALEERYFYPVLRVEGLAGHVERSFAEHAEVKRLLSDIMEMKQRDPRLKEVLSRLSEAVTKHMQEEEQQVFPEAVRRIDDAVLRSTEEEMRRAMGQLENEELLAAADHGGLSPS